MYVFDIFWCNHVSELLGIWFLWNKIFPNYILSVNELEICNRLDDMKNVILPSCNFNIEFTFILKKNHACNKKQVILSELSSARRKFAWKFSSPSATILSVNSVVASFGMFSIYIIFTTWSNFRNLVLRFYSVEISRETFDEVRKQSAK